MFAGANDRRGHAHECAGRVVLKFRVGEETRRYYRWLERMYLRHGPRAGSFFRYICLSFIGVWRQRGSERPAYADIYERDLFQCSSPVCSRRDVTPHHLVFRSHGGDDSPDNIASLCVWCQCAGINRQENVGEQEEKTSSNRASPTPGRVHPREVSSLRLAWRHAG
jgi:hypothetical protein